MLLHSYICPEKTPNKSHVMSQSLCAACAADNQEFLTVRKVGQNQAQTNHHPPKHMGFKRKKILGEWESLLLNTTWSCLSTEKSKQRKIRRKLPIFYSIFASSKYKALGDILTSLPDSWTGDFEGPNVASFFQLIENITQIQLEIFL